MKQYKLTPKQYVIISLLKDLALEIGPHQLWKLKEIGSNGYYTEVDRDFLNYARKQNLKYLIKKINQFGPNQLFKNSKGIL